MAKRSIDGKRMLITGASSGIGRSLALQLARRGCRLVLNARGHDRLSELQAEIRKLQPDSVTVVGDVTDPAIRKTLIDTTIEHFGGLDVLVNNAGVGAIGRFDEADEARLRRIMEVNFFAPAELTRTAIPALEKGVQPVVVNISSILGHRGVPMKSEYCASKFALHGLSDSIRGELSDRGVDVLLVSPSTTDSNFFENVIDNPTGDYGKLSKAQTPDYVASRTIKAMERGKHEVILSWSGWGLVLLDRWWPGVANRMVARFGK